MKMLTMAAMALVAVLFPSGRASAQETEHHHHEEQLGTVKFPTSCPAAVQKDFERGIALLHSFWYEEAERSFR